VSIQSSLRALAGQVAEQKRPLPTFGRRLAEALSWGGGASTLHDLGEIVGCRVTQGLVADEPAALFFGHRRADVNDRLREAALYAYHSSVEWCVLTNTLQTRVFNSHWVHRNDWFALPKIPRNRLDKAEILRAVNPYDVVTGLVDDVATRMLRPEASFPAVDDALFETLNRWRYEAFRFAPSATDIDERLHNLFVQLFVLRVVEDKGQLAKLRPLSDVLRGTEEIDTDGLRSIFGQAREEIQGELFEADVPPVPAFVLNGIIRDLYTPHHLPIADVHYNFAWIDPDILGRAYEKYVSTVLTPIRISSQQTRLFGDEPKRELQRVSKRKSYGIYYTPAYLTRFLADAAVRLLGEQDHAPKAVPSVIDIACGSGSFLAAAMDAVVKTLRQSNPKRNWGRFLIENQKIVGIDIDTRAVSIARLSLWLRLVQEPEPLPLPALERCVVAGDSLADDVWTSLPDTFDVILGNPPFLATGDVPTRGELAQRFQTAQGRFDYSWLFIERSLGKLKVGGALALVIPNRLFANRDADVVRSLITKQADLVTIVDFGSLEVFAGTSAYIGLLVAEKAAPGATPTLKSRFIDVTALPPRLAGAYLADAAFQTDEYVVNRFLEAFDAPQPSGDRPWIFLSPSARSLIATLSVDSQRLGDVANVFQGITTGANDLLVVEKIGAHGHLIHVQNALGDAAFLEQELLVPVVFGSDLQRYVPIAPTKFLIYPYIRGQALREELLASQYPQMYEYLQRYEGILKTRSSVTVEGRRWYELIRKRDERWLRARKLLMRDLAPVPSFTLDYSGTTFLIKGTAVVPTDEAVADALLGFLNSTFVAWYLDQKTPAFRGGYKKYEPQHLTEIPIPSGFFDDSVQDALARLARDAASFHQANGGDVVAPAESRIDDLIDGLLPEGERAYIRSRRVPS
jgi:methylase of polypeptide subunit release factors